MVNDQRINRQRSFQWTTDILPTSAIQILKLSVLCMQLLNVRIAIRSASKRTAPKRPFL